MEVEYELVQMIQMLRSEHHADVVEAIIFYIKMPAGKLQHVIFIATHCQYNKAVHKVVGFVSRVGGNHVWDQVWPKWVFDILVSNVNISIRL